MACLIYTGITAGDSGCDGVYGGLKKLYLGNYKQFVSVSYNPDTLVITAATMSGGANFYGFEFEDSGANFNEDLAAGGSGMITQTIVADFQNLNQEKMKLFEQFKKGKFIAIVQGADEDYYFVAYNSIKGLAAQIAKTTGKAPTDIAQLTLTLTAESTHFARQINASVVASLIS